MANPSNIPVSQPMEKVVEPVRSRWTPKPEQILILESIFNSGMVNPPKDETVRIRKLLEKFGAVGDANVFYWFQNRRSRSRRRQRQIMQAAATSTSVGNSCEAGPSKSVGNLCEARPSTSVGNGGGADDLFAISRQMGGFDEFGGHAGGSPATNGQDLHYHTGLITVFINGVPSEVPKGPIDMGAMFGNDVMLVHSSGEIVPSTEYGILFQGLQMGESYFLVSRPSL